MAEVTQEWVHAWRLLWARIPIGRALEDPSRHICPSHPLTPLQCGLDHHLHKHQHSHHCVCHRVREVAQVALRPPSKEAPAIWVTDRLLKSMGHLHKEEEEEKR